MKTETHCGQRKSLAIVAALALALALSAQAQAQAQNANDQAAAGAAADQGSTNVQAASATAPADQSTAQNGAAGEGALQEVVVTAERRAVNIQQTPIAVIAIEGDQLQSLHLVTTSDLQFTVPGYQSENQGGVYENNNIRGLGVPASMPTLSTGVKEILDGIVQDINAGLDQPLYDMSDIEVLQGPQGTFVGASAIGGAIEETSVNPNFNGFNGYVEAGVGSYEATKLQGAVNLPVSDTFAMRLAFDFEQEESFSDDIGNTQAGYYYTSYSATAPQTDGPPKQLLQDSVSDGPEIDPGSVDDHALRLKALWKPTDNFQSLTELNYTTTNTGGLAEEPNPLTYQSLFAYPSGCSTVAGTTFTGTQLVCAGAGATSHSTYYYPGEEPFVLDYYGTAEEFRDSSWQASEELRYTLPDGIVVRSMSGFWEYHMQMQSNNSNGPEDAGWNYHSPGVDQLPSEEIDIISPTTGKVNWITGAYYEYRFVPIPTSNFSIGSPYQPNTLPTVYSESIMNSVGRVIGLFGQLNWQFTNTLQLQVGARENWDDNTASNVYPLSPAPGTLMSGPFGLGTYSILYTAAACGTITPPCYKVISQSISTGHYTDAVPTGKVDLNWTPLPGQNFYLFYARGYSAGGVNAGSADHPTFRPEIANDWEVGWKGRVLDGHMLTQIGAYRENIQNYQFPVEDTQAAFDTSVGTYDANFAPSLIEGVTVAEQSRFGGLGVDLTFDYNHTSLGNVQTLNQSALPAGFGTPLAFPQCLAGHTYTAPQECFNYTPYLTNLSGEEFPFAPLLQGNISVDYLFHVRAGTLDPRVTYSYTSKQYGALFENSYNEMGMRSLLDASMDWVVGKWDTQLWGKNLNNETYFADNIGSAVYYGVPRQLGIQTTYRF